MLYYMNFILKEAFMGVMRLFDIGNSNDLVVSKFYSRETYERNIILGIMAATDMEMRNDSYRI